jgi:tetratricopeptide (TPR) repeat protein
LERPAQAGKSYQQALDIRIEIGDFRNQAATLAKLGELCVEGGDHTGAIAYCERALQISRDTYDQRKVAEALSTMAVAFYMCGDHDESIACAEEAVALCHAMSDARGEARALEILAHAQQATGDRAAADHGRARALSLIPDSVDPIAARIRVALNSTALSESGVPGPRENSRIKSTESRATASKRLCTDPAPGLRTR